MSEPRRQIVERLPTQYEYQWYALWCREVVGPFKTKQECVEFVERGGTQEWMHTREWKLLKVHALVADARSQVL